ncbi:hypothetical protein [Candidatus Pyrohabitans sp.]
MPALREIIDAHVARVPYLSEVASRCLATERWGGSVVCMLADAAITSTGVNYFTVVVPRVEEFRRRFVAPREITRVEDLALAELEKLLEVWGNRRSWKAAQSIAAHLAELKKQHRIDDRRALRRWAREARLESWHSDAIGRVKGVGINTFQYLRMMGGVDTVMPDKIVKRVINEFLLKAGEAPVEEDLPFIAKVHEIAATTQRRAIELCFLAWLVQYRGGTLKRYAEIMRGI